MNSNFTALDECFGLDSSTSNFIFDDTDVTEFEIEITPWNKGKKGVQTAWNKGIKTGAFAERTEEWNSKIGKSNKGRIITEDHRKKISISKIGSKHTDETKKRMSIERKNWYWWNNGQTTKRCVECPGKDWVRGRLKNV